MNKNKLIKIAFIFLPFILAFPFHFLYDWLPFPIFAIYFPVNESIFEHTKLTFTTIIISYLIFYFIYRKKIDKQKYLSSLLISICSSFIIMLSMYYLYRSIFVQEIMILSILSLFIGLLLGQLISIYTYKKGISFSKEISIYSLITITVIFLIFTLNPPRLNFFLDKEKQEYGINTISYIIKHLT